LWSLGILLGCFESYLWLVVRWDGYDGGIAALYRLSLVVVGLGAEVAVTWAVCDRFCGVGS